MDFNGLAAQHLEKIARFMTLAALVATQAHSQDNLVSSPPKPGVPGVARRLAELKPDAVIALPGTPDWIAIGESVWISNYSKNSITRIDPRTNQVAAVLNVGRGPCSAHTIAFGSLWVPLCGDNKLVRIDPETNKITATIPTTIANSDGTIAASADSIWLMTDQKGTMIRINASDNTIAATIHIRPGSYDIAAGEGGVWVSNAKESLVTRVDPATNLVTATISVGPGKNPLVIAAGAGGVWTFNQGDGTVSRIDPSTNTVIANIDFGVPGPGGDVSVGGGSVWVGAFGAPLTRIDPHTNRVVLQYLGAGGDAARYGLGAVWISNFHQHTVWRVNMEKLNN
jgi:YVTN family beta-propeller protein